MSRNRIMSVLGALVVISMILAACAPKPTATPTAAPLATEAPTATPPPHTGAWVDSVTFINQNDSAAGIKQMQAGEIDQFNYAIANADLFKTLKADPNLTYSLSYGSFNELTLNPSVCKDTSKLNPFNDPKVREAMNWLVDRKYIADEIFGGLALPRTIATSAAFPDYSRYIDIAAAMEIKYAYNFDKAKQVISDEMPTLGATLGADGKWQYKGKPVTLIALIRTEDKRRDIGDYVSTQLENIGFTVDRQYKTRSEASPIWNQTDPAECKMNFYTGGWIQTAIPRDDSTNFGYFYTPLGSASPLWAAYTPSPEFKDVADKLYTNDFKTMDERRALWEKAIPLSMQDSVRVWLVDQTSFTPGKKGLEYTYDLAGGFEASMLWPYTLRYTGQVGGDIKEAQPGLLVEPWNPLAGSNWVYDADVQSATQERGVLPDPFTGLFWPARIESAAVTVKEGLPVAKTLDWLTLDFAPEIKVPADAWSDWDVKTQKFITAAEKYPSGTTANVKVTVTYPADLFTTVKWHDGSPISLGDFVMAIIMNFDPGKTDSPIYQEALAPYVEAFLSHFKGLKIESTSPLVITTYDDQFYLDAELLVHMNNWWPGFPAYQFGTGAWHNMALGIRADSEGKLAFSTDKAGAKKVEWMSFVSGPSLEVLKSELENATAESYIPYAPTLGQYVTADEAKARYANLAAWYGAHNNFWVGTGPFYLDAVHPVEQTLTVKRYADFPDPSDKWARFSEPKFATVDITGPASVKIGSEAKFDVAVTFKGAPYPASELSAVKYLVFDATGNLVLTADATLVSDGQYTVTLPADVTSKLAAGSNKLTVAVSSLVVSVPTITSYEFVTTP